MPELLPDPALQQPGHAHFMMNKYSKKAGQKKAPGGVICPLKEGKTAKQMWFAMRNFNEI
ncbi:hypothetical protein [uncultured Gemmiger sp.]|uniref:hypothetical protein n=1 Tax=uncultured Gemmiger sp. TaxID=1623490 RepID=UPI0025FF7ECA|nr:hypothetical protein [uncultured Gemmiger sp.]